MPAGLLGPRGPSPRACDHHQQPRAAAGPREHSPGPVPGTPRPTRIRHAPLPPREPRALHPGLPPAVVARGRHPHGARPVKSQTGKGAATERCSTNTQRGPWGQRRGRFPERGRIETLPGHQENKCGVPPPHTRGRPTTPGMPAGHPGASRDPALPQGSACGASPQVPQGDLSTQPSICPKQIRLRLVRPQGSRPVETLPSEAARPLPTQPPPLHLRTRAGVTGSSWLWDRSLDGASPPWTRHGVTTRTCARVAPRQTPARRDPPPIRRGEARTVVGKEQRSAPKRPSSIPGRGGGRLARPRGLRLGAISRLGTTRRDPGSRRGRGAGKVSPGGCREGDALPARFQHGALGGQHGYPEGHGRDPGQRERGREGGSQQTEKPGERSGWKKV
ncbi:basic salivary proline-rich protein 1-like [Delphinus delphis]|uniref:basic salivary proline-rich protein 1-like n=1 Tax=Delphinus delphis TaxID=9728 RepID=UPI003751DC73